MPQLANDLSPYALERRLSVLPYRVMQPISNAAGIVPATVMVADSVRQQLTLAAAGTGYMKGFNELIMPVVPVFTVGIAASPYIIEMKALDQFGVPFEGTWTKSAATAETRLDMPAVSRVIELFVTPGTGASGDTIAVGWTLPADPQPMRIPSPFRPFADPVLNPQQTADWGTHVYVRNVGAGSTFVAAPAGLVVNTFQAIDVGVGGYLAPLSLSNTPNTSAPKSVISILVGATAQNTTPMEFYVGLRMGTLKDVH